MQNSKVEYAVVVTRHFFAPQTDTAQLELNDSGQDFRVFEDRKSARGYIEKLEDETYHLSHNESGAPDYSVVTVGSRRFRRAFADTWGGAE